MFNFEKRIIDFIIKYFHFILLAAAVIISIKVRKQGMYFVSGDFTDYLLPWFETLKENTGFKGLCMDFYTYYIPYMCILAIGTYIDGLDLLAYIKIISIISEYVCAFLGGLICLRLSDSENKRDSVITVAVLLLSPCIWLNGAYWGQCDFIYIAFILGSLLLLRNHPAFSLILFGIAFSFKLQTFFLLPAYFLYYICTRKFSILNFLYIPAMYLIGGLPAIIAGRPALDVYGIYLSQATHFGQLSMNAPNLWRFFPNMEFNDFYHWGIALTMLIFLILGFYVFKNNYQLTSQTFLLICLCSAGICVMVLPGMHERYTVLYVLLSYLYFLIYDRKKVFIAVILDLITCISLFWYLYGLDVLHWYPLLAIINLGILYYMIMYTLQKLKETSYGLNS